MARPLRIRWCAVPKTGVEAVVVQRLDLMKLMCARQLNESLQDLPKIKTLRSSATAILFWQEKGSLHLDNS